MEYQSSRGQVCAVKAAEAIVMGIAPDGGLFVPDYIPQLKSDFITAMSNMTYRQRAEAILALYLTDFTGDELADCVDQAYNADKFDDPAIAPLVKVDEGFFIQELWHGPTSAFKDMALQLLPHLMTLSAVKSGEKREIVILVATSGDTGKAALEGFKDVAGTRIVVFYPRDGVSKVQQRQMTTQEGNNVHVAAVTGNFDDAQSGVKKIFADQDLSALLDRHNMKLSSANSINWGRLVPQIVYYISAYLDLAAGQHINAGDKINIVVPTGNFGNILAAFYAGLMGVPVGKLICASNANNVLTDFIQTGTYDRKREFAKTISPSMDILISSNLERLLYEITGHDHSLISQWMESLKQHGKYTVDNESRQKIQDKFWAGYCSDDETRTTIKKIWEEKKYLLDPHTAVAVNVWEKYQQITGDKTATIIASTASPFKFGQSVAEELFAVEDDDEFVILQKLADITGNNIPAAIKQLQEKEIRHKTECSGEHMADTLMSLLNLPG
ncbi:MAG TPA: threonine synthase [Syntrophomonadaceae bacterium]|nr:threonine synthase [Syntrophomonadaceae bacterium]HPR94079.1 threonine synthase [Syntrophomonadaceae bacterium]